MFNVKTPVEGFTGKRYGVDFIDGEAKVDDRYIASRLKNLGYKVEEIKEKVDEEPSEENKEGDLVEKEQDIEDMSYDELQSIAKDLGIKANQSTDDLIAAIKEAHTV